MCYYINISLRGRPRPRFGTGYENDKEGADGGVLNVDKSGINKSKLARRSGYISLIRNYVLFLLPYLSYLTNILWPLYDFLIIYLIVYSRLFFKSELIITGGLYLYNQ